MDELYYYLKEIFEEENNNNNEDNIVEEKFPENHIYKSNLPNLYNNNDAFNFILTIFFWFKLFICSINNWFISYISKMRHLFYQIQFILILMVSLFSFVATFEENYNISTDLIISAYFPKKNITYITHEMILEKEKLNFNEIKVSYNDNNVINININRYKEYSDKEINKSNLNNIVQDIICNIMDKKDCNNNIEEYNISSEEKDKIKKIKEQVNNRTKKYNQSNEKKIILPENKNRIFYNIISIKNILMNIFCFMIAYIFIKLTFKSKIRGSLLFNLIIIFIIYKTINDLYQNKYYLASTFIYILLLYINKNLIDSIYLKLKYKRKDFEIFTRNLIAVNLKQFLLKIFILIEGTILSAILSIIFFKSIINYIIYYLCLLTFLAFLGNCFEQKSSYLIKPFKNIIMSFVGIFNLILSKLILKKYLFEDIIIERNICFKDKGQQYCQQFFSSQNSKFQVDCLYFINDLFSFFCLDYINGYIEYQYSIYFYQMNNNKSNNNVEEYEFEEKKYYIIKSNYLWCFFFLVTVLIGYLGIYREEYICFILSLYITKIIMNVFCKLYNIKICRIINNIIILKFLMLIPHLSLMDDYYFINLFQSITYLNKGILVFAIKFIFLLQLFYYIIATNLILYKNNNMKKIKNNNKNNASKFYNFVYILIELLTIYFILSVLIFVYKNVEYNLILKILYVLFVIIFHLLKIPTISDIKDNNKDKKYIINYNYYILIWIVISLRLIKLSGPQVSLLYLVNHINLIILINHCAINFKKNNFYKILIIFILFIGYYSLKSYMIILDEIIIFISPIIKKYKTNKNKNKQKIKNDKITSYKGLFFIFLIFILLIYLIHIRYIYIHDFLDKLKELIKNINILFPENKFNNNFVYNDCFEFYFISKFI